MQPLINGTAYSWAQIKVNIFNRRIAGITKVSYSDEEEITDNYGAGNRPVSRSHGQIKTEGSVELHMSEIEALQAAVPSGRLQDIPEFDITVSYQPDGGRIVNHTLHNCRFKKNMREASTGDAEIKADIDLAISHISWK